MTAEINSNLTNASANTDALSLFRQAAAAGRQSLNKAELGALLSGLGVALVDDLPQILRESPIDLRFSLHNTREFGLVISAGSGGSDATLDEGNFRRDRAAVSAATELTDGAGFLVLFKRTLAYQKLASQAARHGQPLPDSRLQACFEQLLALAGHFAPGDATTDFVLRSLEMNPVHVGDRVTTSAASCEFGPPVAKRFARPIAKIDKLLHPQTIGIIGVSGSGMNFGRIVLRNMLAGGCSKDRLTILRPNEVEIDGVKCVESLKALDHKLDLLIVAIAASAVYDLVDEIIESDAVNAVMLIPGDLGETRKSKEPAAVLCAKINAAHAKPGGGPIFLGANCLGVISHPGQYDSWFIPNERLPKPEKKVERNSVVLSQSGAFMVTRLGLNPWLDPRYLVALGNQTDLTQGDLLTYFCDRPEIETIGIYVEGFKDLDGLDFAKAVRRAVRNGKQIVVYKSGRTAPGVAGVMGHTASIAGDYTLFQSVISQAGAMVAEDVVSFDDLFYMAGVLHHKTVGGNRLGAVGGAGFEVVAMADSTVSDTFSMDMPTLTPQTVTHIEEILVAKRLDSLVEVRNPIDINPGADDEAHLRIADAFAQDPNIDAVVVSLDATAPSVLSLAESKLRPGFDITHAASAAQQMPPIIARNDKPIVAIVDGGPLYEALRSSLKDQGVCVFDNCARGTKALVRYFDARLYTSSLKQ